MPKLAECCHFGQFLEEASRDKYICDLENNSIRKDVACEPKDAVEKSLSCGLSTLEDSNITKDGKTVSNYQVSEASKGVDRKCYRCTNITHLANRRRFRETICR